MEQAHEITSLITTLLGGSVGGGLILYIAKKYLSDSFKKLDDTVNSLASIEAKFATISIQLSTTSKQLEKLELTADRVHVHDRKIAILETRMGRTNGAWDHQ